MPSSVYNHTRMSLTDKIEFAASVFNSVNYSPFHDVSAQVEHDRREVAYDLLQDPSFMNEQSITYHVGIDPNLFGKIIETRGYEVLETIDADREPLFMLDMFRDRNLLRQVDRSTMHFLWKERERQVGEVRFMADKADDAPMHGGTAEGWCTSTVKKFFNSVMYGVCELWEAGPQAGSLIEEKFGHALLAHDEFLNHTLTYGARKHGINGLINHPEIDKLSVVPGCQEELPYPDLPPTHWANKTAAEIMFDIKQMNKASRIKSCYNAEATDIVMSDALYDMLDCMIVPDSGACSLLDLLAKRNDSLNEKLRPFVPFNDAGPGGMPIAMAGTFVQSNIMAPVMAPTRLEPVWHGTKWKFAVVSAVGDAIIRRPNRLCCWTGMGVAYNEKDRESEEKDEG